MAEVVDPISWPPKSPREALLASPSGRKRYLDLRREREANERNSPLKRSRTTPNFFSRNSAQNGDDNEAAGDDNDMDEDEETLRLQLAAIEAKLKLKRLQQEKRLNATSPRVDDKPLQGSFTSSSSSAQPASRIRAMTERLTDQGDGIQVPLSPSKRLMPQDSISPRRALINFKKASEVSLKRPSSARPVTAQSKASSFRPGTSSRSDYHQGSPPDIWSAAADDFKKPKSFSERIAESRNADRAKQQRAGQIQRNRNSSFQIDSKEIEKYKEEAASRPRPSPEKQRPAETFSREEVLQSYGSPQSRMKMSTTTPSLVASASAIASRQPNTAGPGTAGQKTSKEPDTSKLEPFSALNLSNRILPQSFLSRTLENKTVLRIPQLLKLVKAPEFELPDNIDGDYVVFGIVASKSDPKQHKDSKNSTKEVDMYDDGLNNTEKYMVITLTDLKWTIDLFLFDTAFPRYYRLSEGTLIAILNPTILPPPPGKIDTNRFSLCLSSSDDTVLEIGSAQDIGYCKAERKDGKICRSWLDSRKSEFCDFHVDVQIRRTQAARAGVNGGTGLFAPGGRNAPRIADFSASKGQRGGRRGLKPEGGRYDWATQSTYFVAPAPKSASSYQDSSIYPHLGRGSSAAALIDGIQDNPFSDQVRSNANKEERARRRLVEQQREREIAKKLGSKGGNTGSEYLRVGLEQSTSTPSAIRTATITTSATTPGPLTLGSQRAVSNSFKFRKADEVNLGPMKKRARAQSDDKVSNNGVTSSVKKTRFITSKGIREAGRDSLGASTSSEANKSRAYMDMNNDDDDDDDELEII
ncbi:DNA replication protein, putative [Talaromyces stipitatus ATCC 10500]|uniref:DNA replication protein, putative n=1 Tax=Talaromyces stipitatus (strain ATCC 10500 / CBS 375.48 / QM 6759 / NRRL 1006) TaxID=441959 RepID=B8M7J4_TALSN|nr:DNA replication protein, putative [Talaromyces stipitatus ATCC 10500]EED19547.1 DNA replication protein, putative [Talaromyces stipitatus ATCC 10500]